MQRGSLLILRDMARLASKVGRPGRLAVFSDAAIQLCQMAEVLSSLPLWQSAGMATGILTRAGLDGRVLDRFT